MENNINIIWNVLSTILEENFTFAKIKQIVGLSGLKRTLLSDIEQNQSNWCSASQLINEIDKNVKEFSNDDFKHFVNIVTEEILERDIGLKPKLDKYLERLGWQLYNNQIIPIEIFDLSDLQELNENSHQDVINQF